METLIVKTDNAANAKRLAVFLKSIGYVKSVNLEKPMKPLKGADWIKPGRPATEEELEQLAKEMQVEEESGEYFTAEDVKKNAANRLKEWGKKNRK